MSYQLNLTENLAYRAFKVENKDIEMAARQNPAAIGLESDDRLLHLEKEASLAPGNLGPVMCILDNYALPSIA